jgi:hypothetical protein
VDSQLSQAGAGKVSAGDNDDVGSEREPKAPTGSLDPGDPELNFHHHLSAWRLWAAWMERRHATERASGSAAATAQPTVVESETLQVRFSPDP